jgi:hypothetical protein
MYSRLLVSIGVAGLLFASPAFAADASCCQAMKAGKPCCEMPCCNTQPPTVAMPDADLADPFWLALMQTEPPVPPPVAVPARQATVVWFMQPVRVADKILQGRYVIEHDTDRMARGEPCTHIYAYDDQKTPVVAFHCTHLEREVGERNTVVLHSTADGFKTLVEFQFAGESAAHGYPTVR